jgi:hypothetical protein
MQRIVLLTHQPMLHAAASLTLHVNMIIIMYEYNCGRVPQVVMCAFTAYANQTQNKQALLHCQRDHRI